MPMSLRECLADALLPFANRVRKDGTANTQPLEDDGDSLFRAKMALDRLKREWPADEGGTLASWQVRATQAEAALEEAREELRTLRTRHYG